MNSVPSPGTPPAKRPATVFDVLGILWRWRWVIVAMTALAFVVAAGYTMRQTKIYQAEASTLIQRQSLANSLNNILSPGAQANEGPRVATAQAQLATSPVIAARTLKAVPGAGMTVGELLGNVTVEPDANSDVLHFKMQNENGPMAVRLVNVYTAQYVIYSTELSKQDAVDAAKTVRVELRRLVRAGERGSPRYLQLDRNLDSLQSVVALTTPTAQVINTATGYDKVKPKLLIALVLGIVLGFGLGIGLAFVLEALDPRMRSPEAIAEHAALPLLARIPTRKQAAEPVTLRGRDEESLEAYRVLLAAAENVGGSPLKGTLLVACDTGPEHASAAAINLAIANARAGHRTTLVDLGVASPTLTTLLGAGGQPGIVDAVIEGSPADGFSRPIKTGPGEESDGLLRFIPAGSARSEAEALIGSDALKQVVEEIAGGGGLVILDTGSAATSSGALSIAGLSKHTLLVGALKSSRPQSLGDSARGISLSDSQLLGVAAFV